MNPTAVSAAADSSLLMWVLAAIVAILTASICQGWLKQAQKTPTLKQNWKISILNAAVLGTGFTTAVVLALSAEALPFPVGYRLRDAPLLWLGSMILFWPPMALLGCRFGWPHVVGAGVMVALVAVAMPAGWVSAAGFRPGINWRLDAAAAAALFSMVGMVIAMFMVFSGRARATNRRTMWRVGAAVLMGITLLAGQQILMAGTNLPAQVGSVFRTEVPSSLLCLSLGVMVPLLWSLLLLDLYLRRKEQRRADRRYKRNRRQKEIMERGSRSSVSHASQAFADAPGGASVNPSSGAAAGQQG